MRGGSTARHDPGLRFAPSGLQGYRNARSAHDRRRCPGREARGEEGTQDSPTGPSRICAPGSMRCARRASCRRSAAPSARARSAASSISTCARWATAPSCSTTSRAIRAGIASWPTSSPRCARINLTLGLPIDGSPIELVSYWRKYMKEAKSIAARHGQVRAAARERQHRQGHRHPQDPDAALARA